MSEESETVNANKGVLSEIDGKSLRRIATMLASAEMGKLYSGAGFDVYVSALVLSANVMAESSDGKPYNKAMVLFAKNMKHSAAIVISMLRECGEEYANWELYEVNLETGL